MLSFAILHNIPEILSGDYCLFDTYNYKKMIDNKGLVSSKIYSVLPKKISIRFNSLQQEFDKSISKEAQVVKALDRLQHLSTNKSSYKKWSVNSDSAREYIGQSTKDEVSKKLLNLLLDKAIKKKVFPSI